MQRHNYYIHAPHALTWLYPLQLLSSFFFSFFFFSSSGKLLHVEKEADHVSKLPVRLEILHPCGQPTCRAARVPTTECSQNTHPEASNKKYSTIHTQEVTWNKQANGSDVCLVFRAFSAQYPTPSDHTGTRRPRGKHGESEDTYQSIIQQFTNMCILPAKVMVTVIQSARVFHGVVAMDQHMRQERIRTDG